MTQYLLSSKQAYSAMFLFLQKYYELTQADEIGELLGSMQMLEDGSPVDRALLNDWEQAVHASIVSGQ